MTLGWTQVSLLIGLWTPYRFNCGRVVSFDMHGRYFGVSKFRILLNAVGRLGSARGSAIAAKRSLAHRPLPEAGFLRLRSCTGQRDDVYH